MKRIFTILIAIAATVSFTNTQAQISNYCTTNASYTSDSYIGGVSLNTITNTSTACTGYTDYTSMNTTLTKGASYTIEVTYGSCLGNHYTNYMGVWIDFNQNNTFDAAELVGSMGPTTFTGHVLSATFTVPSTALLDTTYMRVKSEETGSTPGPCGGFSWGEAEDYMIIIAPPYADDAGVASIDSPATFCEGSRNVLATIQNYGSNQISSVIVNWSINGVAQTPVNYTSLLDTVGGIAGHTAQVVLGSNFFGAGVTDSIEVWTSNPNSTTDPNPVNDSKMDGFQPSLSGTFTIDPAGTGLTNYTTFAAAVADLNAFGVCGPATFAVAAGTFNEQLDLGSIGGASSMNQIVFMADTAGVIVEYGATGSSDNFVLSMNGTEWVTFDGFTFQNATGGSLSYRALVKFDGGSSNNTIKNNVFKGFATTSSSANTRGWTTNSAGNDNNMFMDNEFLNGGYYGFYFRGSNNSLAGSNNGNEFTGNLFDGGYYYATYFYYGANMKFNNNTIKHNSTSTTTGYGFYCYYQYGHTEAIGNKVDYRYNAFRAYYWYGDENDRNIIANNMIHSGLGTYTTYGMYVYYCEYTDVAHNTIWSNSGPTSTNYATYWYYGSKNRAFNNVVYRPQGSAGQYGIYSPSTTAFTVMDHNNVWAPTGNYGYWGSAKADLTAWQAAGVGANDHDTDPGYTNKDSMYTCNDTLDNAGMAFEKVAFDFDGDNRDPSTPDIGADEFIGSDSSTFSAGPDGLLCNGNSIEIGTQITGADYIWSNGGTTGVIPVSNEGTYTVSVISACGGSFTDDVEVIDNTPFATFNSESFFFTGKFTNTSKRGDDYRWVFYNDPSGKVNPMDTIWQESPIYLFADNGPYWVCLTNYNDCDTVETCKAWMGSVGIDENNLNNVISLMPNPVSENLTIQFNGLESDQINVEMTNVQGQAVYSNQFVGISASDSRKVDVSNLNKGMYIMKFTTENEVSTKRIIVQ